MLVINEKFFSYRKTISRFHFVLCVYIHLYY